MNSKKLVTTYSKSLFENLNNSALLKFSKNVTDMSKITAREKKVLMPNIYILAEELYLVRTTLVASKAFMDFFNNPTYADHQKLTVLLEIFPGLTDILKAFLKLLAEKSHLYLIPEISEEFTKILLKFKNTTQVKVITASSLRKTSGQLLLNTLRKITKSNDVLLSVSYNPKLLGGLMIEYNSTSIDASLLKEFSLFFDDI